MTDAEAARAAVEKAQDQCERGNAAFRAGDVEKALELYTDARLTLMFRGRGDNDPKMQTEEHRRLNNRLNRNLAVAHARVGEYENSLHYAKEALEFESNDVKMLVKKLDAELRLERIGEARQTYTRAVGASHNDPALEQYRRTLERLEREERERQSAMFQKAFK